MTKCCSKCTRNKPTNQFYKEVANKDGLGRWCKECISKFKKVDKVKARARQQQWYYKNHKKVLRNRAAYSRTIMGRHSSMRGSARNRKLECTLTLEEYEKLIAESCFYCGGDLSPAGIGLDRIDPKQGYIPGNVRPCCYDCNTAKMNMTEEQFKGWVSRIYRKYVEGGSGEGSAG